QERRDEAYTDKGAKKTAKGSVFKVAADRVRETREEKEWLQKVVADSEGAEKLLQVLNEKRSQRQEALAVAKERAIIVERLAMQAADRAAASEQVRLLQEWVQRIRKLGTDVEEAEQKSKELLSSEEKARQALRGAQNGKVDADTALKSAEETARAEGSNSAVNDTLVRQQLELRIAAAEQAASGAQQRIDAAIGAQKLVDAAADAERDHHVQQAKARSAQESSTQAAAKERIASDELRRCDLLERALDVRSAERKIADARTAVDKQLALQARLDAALEERTVLAGRRASIAVPAAGALAPMRR